MDDQIALLNVLREHKLDLDQQIRLLGRQIAELSRHIARYESDVESLSQDKDQLLMRQIQLSRALAKRVDDIEELELLLHQKDHIIEILKERVKGKGHAPCRIQMPTTESVDKMLGLYINQAKCLVPIKKLGNGHYMFGTKKIYAKILNGKLVIRVGGGYMGIEEFIATHQDAELARLAKMSPDQIKALGHDPNLV